MAEVPWPERRAVAGDAAAVADHAGRAAQAPDLRRGLLVHRGVSLRWVLTHMIEEYARHLGHADLIRESIDGQTGD